MAETLRDLVVSLSLQTDNFTRNIKSVNTQIKEAESAFKLAASGVTNFEQTTSGLTAKQTTLTRQLNLQKTAVDQYQKALDAAKKKLADCQTNQDTYSQKLKAAEAAMNAAEQAHGKGSRQYKKAAAEVKKLTGQVEAEKKATQNAADAVSTASARLNNAEAAVKSTRAALRQCNTQLTLSRNGFQAAGVAIAANETAVASLGKQMQLAESRYRLAGAGIANFGAKASGAAAKVSLLKEKQAILRAQVQQLQSAVKAAMDQVRAAQSAGDPQKLQEAKDKLTDLRTALNNARAELRETTSELNRQKSAWTQAGEALTRFSSKAKALSSSMVSVGRTMQRWITTPLLGIATASVNAEIQFEKTFATVRKTVSGTEEDYTRLENASKRMSTELAAGTDEINAVMSTAGQLGIATENIESFTKTMIDLGNSTTDLDANTAATEIAKFINIMGTSQSDVDRLGASLAYVGNRYATTEAPIMEMAMRIAGAGKQVGMTEAQVLGVATALSSVGIEAQMGGSAFSKALIKMEVAAQNGGQELNDFAKISGMTATEFKQLWEADPTAAFIRFTKGIAQMDDAGISSISTLQELGFTEIRLRDTMLRTVSNTQLMENAVADATRGWQENTALTKLAGEIYGTTAAKLTNLKNKASLAGQQIASDLTPIVQNLISAADGLLDKFMGLDEQQRLTIVKWGAVAAAMGPALLILGKIVGAVGTVTGALGKGMLAVGRFSGAVANAGGGMKGLLSVVGSSKLAMVSLTAAVVYGAYKLYDYASGAKAARDALASMNKTAQNWKDTAADTFYSSGKGLDFFGLSSDDFTKTTTKTTSTVQDWMDGMVEVWSDGKRETDAIVKEWKDSSDALSKDTRDHMVELRDQAQASGDTAKVQEINAAIAELDALDARIKANLNYFQNKTLTDKNKAFWQGLMDQKQAILLKWGFEEEPEGGTEAYDTIAKKVRAAEARAEAMGQEVSTSLYEEATLATAQGYAAVLQQINDGYDAEYEKIIQISDATERQNQLDALNKQYTEQRAAAAKEYAGATQGYLTKMLDSEQTEKTKGQVISLYDALQRLYDADVSGEDTSGILTELANLTEGMDEGALTEYLTMLTQISSLASSGLSEDEIKALFPDVDFDDIDEMLKKYAEIGQYLDRFKDVEEIKPLNTMFNGAVSEEVLKIATDLNLDGAKAAWEAFAAAPGASITTDAYVDAWEMGEEARQKKAEIDAKIASYTDTDADTGTLSLTAEGVTAFVKAYNDSLPEGKRADMSSLKPEAAAAFVKAYEEIAGGANIDELTPDEIVAKVLKYEEEQGEQLLAGLNPEVLKAMVLAYSDEGASTDALRYAWLLQHLPAEVTSYTVAPGIGTPTLNGSIAITGYDLQAYLAFKRNNKDLPISGRIKLGDLSEADWKRALGQGRVTFYDKNGIQIPASAKVMSMLTPGSLVVLDEDGTMHVLVTPVVAGTQEAVDAAVEEAETEKVVVNAFGKQYEMDWGWLNELYATDAFERMNMLTLQLDNYGRNIKGTWKDFRLVGSTVEDFNRQIESTITPNEVASLQAFAAQVVAVAQSGGAIRPDDLQHLRDLTNLMNAMQISGTGSSFLAGMSTTLQNAGWTGTMDDLLATFYSTSDRGAGYSFGAEVGEQVAAGIGEGQKLYDFGNDAELTFYNDLEALNEAADINSPSKRMKPTGGYIAAGVGAGMAEYDFSSDAAATVGNLDTALTAAFTASRLRSVGLNAMYGMAAGVRAGQASVISAMRTAAQNAVTAAKTALQIHSPSRVFRDEVGAMTMKGFGEGVLQETKEQAQVIRNASRYLTTAAGSSAIAATNDNRKTYNNDNSTSFSFAGATFQVRSEQDVHDLAVELATLTRRNQRGKGLRMA